MRVTARGRTPTSPDEVFPTLAVGDIVRTPKGALGIVRDNGIAPSAVAPGQAVRGVILCYPEDSRGEKGGWWRAEDGLILVARFSGIKRMCAIRAGVQKS